MGSDSSMFRVYADDRANLADEKLTIGVDVDYAFIINTDVTNTNYQWTFGVDGELTLPTGGRLGAIDPKGGTMLDGGFGSNVSVTSFYSTGNYSSCVTASAGGQLYITAYNDGGPNPSRQWIFDKDGSLTLPEGGVIKNSTGTNILDGLGGGSGGFATTSTLINGGYTVDLSSTGTLTIPGEIIGSNIDPNVYIETVTGSINTWTFGINGILTLPAETPIIKGGGTGTDVTIVASTGTNTSTWTFGADGGLTFPDTSVQTTAWLGGGSRRLATVANSSNNFNIGNFINNASLDINYTAFTGDNGIDFDISYQEPLDGTKGVTVGAVETPLIMSTGTVILNTDVGSSTSTWTFGTDGGLTLPNGGTLRMSTAPISSTGTVGDIAGTIAVNTASIFYCIADFVLDTGTYSVVTTDSNNGSVFFMEIAKGSYPQPQIGWDVSISGNLSHIDDTPTDLGTSWRISVSGVTAYSTGTSVTLTNPSPSQPDIWVKQAWGTTGSW
jgi:hypothetical protein